MGRYKWQMVTKEDGVNPWITYIKDLVFEQNNSLDAVVVGGKGTGKSWGVLRFCKLLDPDFELEGNWYFKAGAFMRDVEKYYSNNNPNQKRGKIWVLDEIGVDLNNLNYMDEVNKGLNLWFQTGRHRNYIFFGTVPFISFISKGVRKLMNCRMEALGWNKDNKTIFLPRVLQYNDEKDQFYNKMLIVDTGDDHVKCNQIGLPKPPVALLREYEKRKKQFTSNLSAAIADRIDFYEQKQLEKYMGRKPTEQQETILSMLKEGDIIPDIAKAIGISPANIARHMKLLREKRGIDIAPIRVRGSQKVSHYNVYDPREKLKTGLV